MYLYGVLYDGALIDRPVYTLGCVNLLQNMEFKTEKVGTYYPNGRATDREK